MQQVSNREYETWMEWFAQQWNEPDRADHYAMQIAAEIRRVLHSKPATVRTDHFALKFVRITPEDVARQSAERLRAQEEAQSNSLRFWLGFVGLSPDGRSSN